MVERGRVIAMIGPSKSASIFLPLSTRKICFLSALCRRRVGVTEHRSRTWSRTPACRSGTHRRCIGPWRRTRWILKCPRRATGGRSSRRTACLRSMSSVAWLCFWFVCLFCLIRCLFFCFFFFLFTCLPCGEFSVVVQTRAGMSKETRPVYGLGTKLPGD